MVLLGRANSRMKDYCDVWMLMSSLTVEPERLRQAIAATFARRNTEIPAHVPDGLSDQFAADVSKQRQWNAFVRNLIREAPEFDRVVRELRERLAVFTGQKTHRF
jgi:hypothetical protein